MRVGRKRGGAMAQTMGRCWRGHTLLLVLAVLCSLTLAAQAATADSPPLGFYQATAIVTGTDLRQRPYGFANCLMQVLTKLTGKPKLRDDPAAKALADHAETLVEGFAYVDPRAAVLHHDDQGTYDRSHELTVRFKPEEVDAALGALGLAIWPGPRPLLTPVILVRTRDPDPYLLSLETPRGVDMRLSLVRIAAGYGVGVHFPTDGELAEWGVDTIGPPDPLGPADTHRVRVTGTLSFNIIEGGWTGSWWAEFDGVEHHWEIHRASYDQAFDSLASGAVELAAATGRPEDR